MQYDSEAEQEAYDDEMAQEEPEPENTTSASVKSSAVGTTSASSSASNATVKSATVDPLLGDLDPSEPAILPISLHRNGCVHEAV